MEILIRVLEQQASVPVAAPLPQDGPAQVEADSDEEGYSKFVADLDNCIDDELGSEQARSWEPPSLRKRLRHLVSLEFSCLARVLLQCGLVRFSMG